MAFNLPLYHQKNKNCGGQHAEKEELHLKPGHFSQLYKINCINFAREKDRKTHKREPVDVSDSHKDTSNSSESSWKPINSNSSLSHNFQKHAVVTIKKLTAGLTSTFGNSSSQKLALQMWNIFLSSGIKSKRILVILFGQSDLQKQTYNQLLKSCFYGELCSYDDQLVRAAQNILRLKVLKILTDKAVSTNVMSNRHILMKEQFIAYFNEFVSLLKQGPLIKFRINTSSTKRIEEKVKTETGLRLQRSSKRCKRH